MASEDGGCVTELLLDVEVAVWPWKAFAAISASAPESATTAAATQRVVAEIRRRPASRRATARCDVRPKGGGSLAITVISFPPGVEILLSGT